MADENWCGAKKGFILGTVKGQDRQQTEQCGGRGWKEEVVSKKGKGYEARQGGVVPSGLGSGTVSRMGLWQASQHGPLYWTHSQKDEKEDNSLKDRTVPDNKE